MFSRDQYVAELSSLLQQLKDSWGSDGSAETGKQNGDRGDHLAMVCLNSPLDGQYSTSSSQEQSREPSFQSCPGAQSRGFALVVNQETPREPRYARVWLWLDVSL